MATRLLDATLAAAALIPAAPLCLAAALGIWLADGRPVLHPSPRVGLGGRRFTMYKFRTMYVDGRTRAATRIAGGIAHRRIPNSRITAARDRRVFTVGHWLRTWKIDELPQLVNVLRGDMAIIGPRPEDPAIVDACFGPLARETLTVRPGLASPGSIYNFTHGERQLGVLSDDAESAYVDWLLPRKLALDLVYVRHASLCYDLRLVCRAALVILARGVGRRSFPEPPEWPRARALEPLLRVPPAAPAAAAHDVPHVIPMAPVRPETPALPKTRLS
jgi:lipopolysaccharide/colanic/teichoic acid biosynthesis glycosyltransferase